MGKRAKSGGRLRIHRETMRSLSAQSLSRVAGGDDSYAIVDDDPCPKTNAWTAGEGQIKPDALCGGGLR